jgi:monofunctional biosynthetic peptidoglycan transglycosylase
MIKKAFKYIGIFILSYLCLSILLTLAYIVINPPITILMMQRPSKVEHQWVDLEEISPKMIQAVVASEDNLFLSHNGFDFEQIKIAAEEAKRKNKAMRGASTISQQTAKNVFLWNGRSYLRKGLEVWHTFLIETFWSKERIMEVYLNVIEYGDGIYGIEAASQHYFNRSAKKLTKRQSALIAAALPSPLKRNPAYPTKYLNRRANKIMRLMNNIGPVKFE